MDSDEKELLKNMLDEISDAKALQLIRDLIYLSYQEEKAKQSQEKEGGS